MDKTKKKLIASISRAVGNDLRDYSLCGDELTLSFRPPLNKDLIDFVRHFVKHFYPTARVKTNTKQGKILVVL